MKRQAGVSLLIGFAVISLWFPAIPGAQEKKGAEETYSIKPGDTLWDISSRFLKNPYLWPKLWQRNPYITNPHWIYPGKEIRLTADAPKPEPAETAKPVEKEVPKEAEVKKPEPVREEKKTEPTPLRAMAKITKADPMEDLKTAGFMSDVDFRGLGTIVESREGKMAMTAGDICYLAMNGSEALTIGDRFTIFRASELITHPLTGRQIGRRYNITGNLQVIDQNGPFYTAKVVESFAEVFKGDMIRPYMKERMEGGAK
jgi:hypothetical protein